MDEYTNPAKRLLAVVEKIQQSRDGEPAVQAWAKALGIDVNSAREEPHELYEKLGLIHRQISLTQELMGNEPFSEELYVPYLDRVRRIVSISNLDSPWGNYKGHLQSDTLLALRYCTEILPREASIPVEELESLLNSIMKMRTEIDSSSFSPGVKEFLLRHLLIIETGIRDYPISGSSSIASAFHESFKVAASARPVEGAEEARDKAAHIEVMRILGRLWGISKEVLHGDKLIAFIGAKIEQGRPMLEWLNNQ